jgi:phosphoribosylanthranilate isomerase
MSYKIKASSITNLSDARYFAARDVRWMGFCLDPASADYLQPNIAQAIMEWIEGPHFVGEFGLQSAALIRATAEQLGIKAVQLCPDTPAATIRELRSFFVLLEIAPPDIFSLPAVRTRCEELRASVEVFLIDFTLAGIDLDSLKKNPVLLEEWRQFFREVPAILEVSGDTHQVIALITALQPYGISLKGGDEEKPGYKSFDELEEILDALVPE